MAKLSTVKVIHKEYKIEMLINEKDFDPSIHEKAEKRSQRANKKDFKIIEKDGKFVVVNKKQEQVDNMSYETEADAKLAIQLLTEE